MIPAGLTDNNIEFFAVGRELYSIQDGKRFQYPDIPQKHAMFLIQELEADPIAQETLVSIPDEDKIRVYGICRFGACNATPDFTESECTDNNEYFDCGIRGRCEFEGKRCKELVIDSGILSFRQLQIMILVANGKINKEIADILHISENTVANHMVNIHQKIGGRTRVDIATFIKERGIA